MPKKISNRKIIKILSEIENLLIIKGELYYKTRAYKKACQSIKELGQDISIIYSKKGVKGLEEIPGIGKGISKKIEEYIKTGKIKYYEDLKKSNCSQKFF